MIQLSAMVDGYLHYYAAAETKISEIPSTGVARDIIKLPEGMGTILAGIVEPYGNLPDLLLFYILGSQQLAKVGYYGNKNKQANGFCVPHHLTMSARREAMMALPSVVHRSTHTNPAPSAGLVLHGNTIQVWQYDLGDITTFNLRDGEYIVTSHL